MKKLKFKINHELFVLFYNFLAKWMEENRISTDNDVRLAYAVIDNYLDARSTRNLVRYRFTGEKKVTLNHDTAFAIAIAIEPLQNEGLPSNYLGNFLLQLYAMIDKLYATINFSDDDYNQYQLENQ